MNEKFIKNAKVEQLTKVVLSHGEEKGLIVKDPLNMYHQYGTDSIVPLWHSCTTGIKVIGVWEESASPTQVAIPVMSVRDTGTCKVRLLLKAGPLR